LKGEHDTEKIPADAYVLGAANAKTKERRRA
jgi:hypothetical protein